jgi:hypothetical protein
MLASTMRMLIAAKMAAVDAQMQEMQRNEAMMECISCTDHQAAAADTVAASSPRNQLMPC